MDNHTLEQIFSERQEILSLPQTLAEVLRLTRDEDSSAEDIASILEKDPGLTTKVLKIANSAYFGKGRSVGSIKQAVVTIGLRQITALALSSSVYSLSGKWGSAVDPIRFWRHSLEVAIAARMISEAIGYKRSEEMFVGGLLHDIGIMILSQVYPSQFPAVWKNYCSGSDLIHLEEETWGTSHARVGRFIMDQWRLPESICSAVGLHHNIFLADTDEEEFIPGQIIALADRISRFTIRPVDGDLDPSNRENREVLLANLGLTEEKLLSIEKSLFGKTVEEASFLEIEIGSSDELIREANDLLYRQYLAVENLLAENRRLHQQNMKEGRRKVSLDSLKLTTSAFARSMDDAVGTIGTKTKDIGTNLDSGKLIDTNGETASSIESILSGVRVIYGLTNELKNVSALDESALADYDYVSRIQEKFDAERETITEPV